jgi:hypothetical protein
LSGFALTDGLFPTEAFASTGLELAERSPIADSAIAAIKPNSAAVFRHLLPLVVFVRSFMTYVLGVCGWQQ